MVGDDLCMSLEKLRDFGRGAKIAAAFGRSGAVVWARQPWVASSWVKIYSRLVDRSVSRGFEILNSVAVSTTIKTNRIVLVLALMRSIGRR
jgi:hypothetical protein